MEGPASWLAAVLMVLSMHPQVASAQASYGAEERGIERVKGAMELESVKIDGLDDPKLADHVPADLLKKFREEIEMARELLPAFDRASFLNGSMTPIWFGSAINSFGVKELMDGIANYNKA